MWLMGWYIERHDITGTKRKISYMMQGSFAERLRILRAREGLTLTEASERIGITRHTLSSLERGGQEPHYPTLAKIAKGYGVPVEELIQVPALAGKAEAREETGPPQVSRERLQEHFENVRPDEVDYLNDKVIADLWRLALPGEKPRAHFVPDDIDTERIWQFLDHALGARNVFEPEEVERLDRGRKKAVVG